MLRNIILVLSAVLAISAAASAEITVTIGSGRNGYYPNQYPYPYPAQQPVYVPVPTPNYYPAPVVYPNQGYVNNCPPPRAYYPPQRTVIYGNGKHHKNKHRGNNGCRR